MKNVIEKFVVENSHDMIINKSYCNCIDEYVKQIEHLFWLEYEGELKLEAELESMTYENNKVTAEYSLKAKYNGKYESEFILIINNADDEYMSYKTNVIIK